MNGILTNCKFCVYESSLYFITHMHEVPSRFLIKEDQSLLSSKLKSLSLATIVTIMAVALVVFPQESFEASKSGLHMWWQIVFPSLLPFLIISELLISFGVVSFFRSYSRTVNATFFSCSRCRWLCLGDGTSVWISCRGQIHHPTSVRKTSDAD